MWKCLLKSLFSLFEAKIAISSNQTQAEIKTNSSSSKKKTQPRHTNEYEKYSRTKKKKKKFKELQKLSSDSAFLSPKYKLKNTDYSRHKNIIVNYALSSFNKLCQFSPSHSFWDKE